LYAVGTRRLWRAAGAGHGVKRWQAAAFWAGWLTLVIALVSPLHPLGEALFSAHMVQHELLMVVAAPLLVLGRPIVPMLWALPIRWRRTVGGWGKRRVVSVPWRFLTAPLAAFALHGVALWLWHVPRLYEETLFSEGMHALQHASFLLTALLFWWALIHGREGRLGYGAAVLYLFGTMLHTGALGALLTFSSTLWYPAYGGAAAAWGLTPLEAQELAGLVMWIPAGTSYLIAALALLARWMRLSEDRAVALAAARRGPEALAGGR
ncbi:MAG TPA: cytochrome c oxidase assembly protein, partial [Gemmatimonadaceae bacterium]|nr:cytochrome c oxidase assembly protein [Gemmatimonadaceae bacterium]